MEKDNQDDSENNENKNGGNLIEIKSNEKRKCVGEMNPFAILGLIIIIYIFVFLSINLTKLIISIANLVKNFKIFYLLSIISIIPTCSGACVSIFFLMTHGTTQKIILFLSFIVLCIIDGFSYYFYFAEHIKNLAILIISIISDFISII